MSLRIVKIPPGAVIVGPPCPGSLAKGIPFSGPFDSFSAALANRAAGNHAPTPVIESLAGSIELEILAPCRIGISGCRSKITSSELKIGDRILIEPSANAARIYIAIGSGIPSSAKLGMPIAIKSGDLIESQAIHEETQVKSAFPIFEPELLHARFQPNSAFVPEFDERPIEATVGVHSDRKGVRLHSLPDRFHNINMRSEPQCIGAIEWTPSGEWIILGPDGPTLGGYPRLGWIIRSSMPTVAQLRPGAKVAVVFVDETQERAENQRWDAMTRIQIEGLSGIGLNTNPS